LLSFLLVGSGIKGGYGKAVGIQNELLLPVNGDELSEARMLSLSITFIVSRRIIVRRFKPETAAAL
jgi:hypothetical protein